jgi:hypothetical protein
MHLDRIENIIYAKYWSLNQLCQQLLENTPDFQNKNASM